MAPAAEGLHLFGKRRAVTMALSREEILGGSRIWEETSSDLVILAKTKAATSPFLFQAWRSSGFVGSGLRQPLASSPVLARRMWSLPLARPPRWPGIAISLQTFSGSGPQLQMSPQKGCCAPPEAWLTQEQNSY